MVSITSLSVYSMQGRGGGWRLLGGARTDLSGLTIGEARALFLVAGPAAAATPEVKAALRKLVRALPETFRDQAEAAAASLVVDSRQWNSLDASAARTPRFLAVLQDAVIRGVQVQFGYIDAAGNETERIVHPLGIVAKGPSWYLVAHTDTGQRTFRIDRVTAVTATEHPVARPDGFDLARSWSQVTDDADRLRTPVEVHATCAPEGLEYLRAALGDNLDIGAADADGRIAVVLRGPSEYGLAGHLAGLVEWLEISRPQGVRDHLATIGAALTDRYGPPEHLAAQH